MQVPRRRSMDPAVPGIFHIRSEIVRGKRLLGKDDVSGSDYSHRRQYLKQRIEALSQHFAIAVGWQAVLPNEVHLVLANLPQLVSELTDTEVLRRVARIFPWKFGQLGVKNGDPTEEQVARFASDSKFMSEMRSRLSDPSWFMRQLLHPLAVRSNQEDNVRGHFVASRFKHRVITDERGVLIAGMHVDLSELRSREVACIAASTHTSAGLRLEAHARRAKGEHAAARALDGHLAPICRHGDDQQYPTAGAPGSKRASDDGMLSLSLDSYLQLLRHWNDEPHGRAPDADLGRLQLDPASLTHYLDHYDQLFPNAVGGSESLRELSNRLGGLWSTQVAKVAAVEAQLEAAADVDDQVPQPRQS